MNVGRTNFDDLRWRGEKREEIEGQFRPRNPRPSNRDWITNDRVGFIFERDYSMKPIASFFSPRLSNISNRNAPTTRDRNLRLWSESWISPVSFHFLFSLSLSLSSASHVPRRFTNFAQKRERKRERCTRSVFDLEKTVEECVNARTRD